MGQELDCKLRYQRRTLAGKAYLETDYVLFRGPERLKVPLKDVSAAAATDGVLTLEFPGGPAAFELGPAAAKWAGKILHPPSLLDKLGVKASSTVALVGNLDPAFLRELEERGAVAGREADAALVFFAARKKADLARVPKLAARLKPDAALWIVYPKGVAAIREIDVLEAGRAAGLKDTKVASFSATHTALRFVIPLAAR